MALFITFEGGEGSGKSTQAKLLVERLRRQKKWGVTYCQEPGTTIIGKQVRDWLRSPERPLVVMPGSPSQLILFNDDNDHTPTAIHLHADSPRAELLAFVLARSQLVEEFILPKLKGKNIVVSNRYGDSTITYQGYGRQLDLKLVKTVNDVATQGLKPNLTILLDIAPERGLVRKFGVTRKSFEKEELEFHQRVRQGYLELVKNEPERWVVIDGEQGVETIAGMIWKHVRELISGQD